MTDEVTAAAPLADLADYGGGAAPAGLPILSLAELREHAKSVSWVVKHVIPADSIGLLFGGSGTFKSFIALDLALHVAHGLEWLGRKTRRGTVLIVAAEGGAVLLREILEQNGIIDWLAERLVDPRAQDQIDYPRQELLRTLLVLYGQG